MRVCAGGAAKECVIGDGLMCDIVSRCGNDALSVLEFVVGSGYEKGRAAFRRDKARRILRIRT